MNEQEVVTSVLNRVNSLRQTMSDEERLVLDSLLITDFTDEVDLHTLTPGMVVDQTLAGYLQQVVVVFDSESDTYIAKLPPLIE